MSERDHMRKIFGFHPPMVGLKPVNHEPCHHCHGTGDSGEQGTENTCRACSGTGLHNKLND